jgi:tol-pal system protein YbgF
MMRVKALVLGLGLGLALAVPLVVPVQAAAQDQTLADIRQELSVLYVDLQRLRSELTTSGAPGVTTFGNTPLERLNAIESELQRLTSKTEALENRINRITVDGTNRIGDLEFRLCEVESGCDIGQLGDTPSLGGVDSAASVPTPNAAPTDSGPALAIGERADFERAQEALASGDFRSAADQFATFIQTYPGGPLSGEAHFRRGEALEELGEMTAAARAFLDSFSGAPSGSLAPDALYKLGTALAAIGQTPDACVTLSEVAVRFPGTPAVNEAQTAMRSLGCS